ncbi:hypothetical protein [Limnothrix sp. FACHB-881]|uniref:hypothetical protein n=1 Tax=Limnothrix sp. FACHB-881 TaxID=2692819 RepID=UPI00168A3131|nr:hypothetical protein [Limnothrix sp. FACHB-881]
MVKSQDKGPNKLPCAVATGQAGDRGWGFGNWADQQRAIVKRFSSRLGVDRSLY